MGTEKITTDVFKERVFEKHGDSVEVLSEYNGGTLPIDFVYHCKDHGDTYKTINAKNILAKCFSPCKECTAMEKSKKAKHPQRFNKEYQYNRLNDYVESNGGKLITNKWTKAKSQYEIDCGNPEHPNFFASADSLLNKSQWCPYCCGRKGDFEEQIKEIIHSKNGELLSGYTCSTNHVQVKCNEHNYIWDIMPLNIKKGRWCPVCSLPYSEKVVYDYLTNMKYNVKIQYTFDDLYGDNKSLLKYDFALLDNNENLLGLLEVDDVEHRYNTTQPRRIKARKRDKMKDEYCKSNNIELFRLEYNNTNKDYSDYDWYYRYISEELNSYLNKIHKQ